MRTKHVPVLAAVTAALVLTAAPVHAEGKAVAGPCDELAAYLRETLTGEVPLPSNEHGNQDWEESLEHRLRSDWHTTPPAYISRVTLACREAIQRGDAPVVVAAARAWTQRPEPGWIEQGRIMLCAMQDPGSLAEISAWMADAHVYGEARAVCASALATWPGAEPQRFVIATRAVRARGDWRPRWEIDPALVAAANARGTPELREQLVPVLVAAHARRARGYDRLQDAVCTDDGKMSAVRTRTCSTLPLEAEADWWGEDRWKRGLASGALSAAFAGLATALVQHDHEKVAGLVLAPAYFLALLAVNID
jgi:hypothetical protein